MLLKHTVQLQISLDSEAKRKLFADDAVTAATSTNGFASQANSVLTIPPAGLKSLSFGDVQAVRGLYLETSLEALVRLNGAADPLSLKKADNASATKLFIEAEITQVTVENPGADTLSGVYVVWGDPTT